MSAEAAVGDLCAAIGVPVHELPLLLSFERSGEIRIECRGEFMFVYLVRPVPVHRRGIAAAALRLVHPDRGLPHPVRAAFYGEDRLVLLCRLSERSLDLPTLDGAMQLLTRLADEAERSA